MSNTKPETKGSVAEAVPELDQIEVGIEPNSPGAVVDEKESHSNG